MTGVIDVKNHINTEKIMTYVIADLGSSLEKRTKVAFFQELLLFPSNHFCHCITITKSDNIAQPFKKV